MSDFKMHEKLKKSLKLYFLTDHQIKSPGMFAQVKDAIKGGATMIQYRNKDFLPGQINEVYEIADICRLNKIPFIINDDILLAKAVNADGLHIGQSDSSIESARKVLGKDKIIGISISSTQEFLSTDLEHFDYIGLGPVFHTDTKKDASKASGLEFLNEISKKTDLPIVAIGGINLKNTLDIINNGGDGIAVISAISRSEDIIKTTNEFAKLLNIETKAFNEKWNDEFSLIEELKKFKAFKINNRVGAGDDAALLKALKSPVISTDTQREDVHFRLDWQSFYEIGFKAVSISLSDLAASYSKPESVFINLGLPDYISNSQVNEIYSGINDNLLNYSVSIGGGNISRAEKLSIDMFVIGEGKKIFPERSMAKKGEVLCSTGHLGLAKAGLEILLKNIKGHDFLVDKFKFPKPRFDYAKILENHGIKCVTDISDGIYGDIEHIAKASSLTAVLTPETFIVDPELTKLCSELNENPHDFIVSGGEDYQLLFTCTKEKFEGIKKEIKDSFIIGYLKEFTGNYIEGFKSKSFNHGS